MGLLQRLRRKRKSPLVAEPVFEEAAKASPALPASLASASVDELEGELARRRSSDVDYVALALESFKDDHVVLAVSQLREARARGCRGEALSDCGEILDCEREMVSFLEDLGARDRWTRASKSGGVEVCAERGAPRGLIRVKCVGVADAPVFALCAALLEVDLFPTWLPGCDFSEVLAAPSRFRRVLRAGAAKGYPIGRNEVVTEAYGDAFDAGLLFGGGRRRRGVAVYMKDSPRVPSPSGTRSRASRRCAASCSARTA